MAKNGEGSSYENYEDEEDDSIREISVCRNIKDDRPATGKDGKDILFQSIRKAVTVIVAISIGTRSHYGRIKGQATGRRSRHLKGRVKVPV